MSLRRCDQRCHAARCVRCSCWCGGLFHGAAGAAARAVFVAAYGGPIPAESPELAEPLLHWYRETEFVRALEQAREVTRRELSTSTTASAQPARFAV